MIEKSHLMALEIAHRQLVRARADADLTGISNAALQIAAFAELDKARIEIFARYDVSDIPEVKLEETLSRAKRRRIRRGIHRPDNTIDAINPQDFIGLEPNEVFHLIRERSGKTQEEFAALLVPPVDKSLIARMESGQRKVGINHVYALARGLKWDENDDRFKVLKENIFQSQAKP